MNHPDSEILNLGLWNEKNKLDFYVKSDTADSSLFQIEDYIDIETINKTNLSSIVKRMLSAGDDANGPVNGKNVVVKKMILEEKNRQLNQFSLIYFNKIKQNTFVSEK